MAGDDETRGELARVAMLLTGIVGLIGLAIAAPIWILAEDMRLPSIDLFDDAAAPEPAQSEPSDDAEVETETGPPPTSRPATADDLMRVTVGPDARPATTIAAPTTTTTTVPLRDESTADGLFEATVEPPPTTTTTIGRRIEPSKRSRTVSRCRPRARI